ncbi:MAG: glycosyltransferase family 2 protein [Pyrinomonadaceae bacterium]
MKISVAMCTYNGARYLREQLESIAVQTHPPHELIVVDDGSNDESVTIVESFAESVPFPVDVHVNAANLGSTKSFERAISSCAGDLIALCDQDDVWLADKLARFAVEFARAPEVGLVFSDAEVVDEDLSPAGYTLWEKLKFGREERERLQHGKGFDSLLQGATVTGATAAFRTCFNSLVLPIPAELPLIHDAWIAVLVAAVSRVLPIPERLVKYRRHASQQVGALERQGPSSGSVHQALERENPYAEMLAIARAVLGRLRERQAQFDSSNVLAGLEAKIAHVSARSGLPNGRLPRAPVVFRELVTGRYHRYSSGFSSAAKDLLRHD